MTTILRFVSLLCPAATTLCVRLDLARIHHDTKQKSTIQCWTSPRATLILPIRKLKRNLVKFDGNSSTTLTRGQFKSICETQQRIREKNLSPRDILVGRDPSPEIEAGPLLFLKLLP